MNIFICPICGGDLIDYGKNLACSKNHSFDRSRKKYVNLLTDNKIKQHGDDKLMCRARHDFLIKDYYSPLADEIIDVIGKHANNGCIVLDSGCGEGWYTKKITAAFPDLEIAAVDISKEALSIANIYNSVAASVYDLPVKSKSVNIILNIFAPFSIEEYKRVLTDDGLIIYAVPMEYHLYGLKSLLYENPYKNEMKNQEISGCRLIDKREIRYIMELNDNADIKNLFMMTPYYYTTGKSGHDIINGIGNLITQVEFCVLTYRLENEHG